MSSNKERYMKILCEDLSDKDLKKLVDTIQQKIVKGYTPEQVAQQLLTAIAQTIVIGSPELNDEEVLEIAEDIGDAVIDRVILSFGFPLDSGLTLQDEEGVPPREQLN
jgi:DNA polymerase III gamma/tau subunit